MVLCILRKRRVTYGLCKLPFFFLRRKSKIVAILALEVEMFLIEVLQLEQEGNWKSYLKTRLFYVV